MVKAASQFQEDSDVFAMQELASEANDLVLMICNCPDEQIWKQLTEAQATVTQILDDM